MTPPKPRRSRSPETAPHATGLRGLAALGEDAVLLGMTEESVEDIMATECARNPAHCTRDECCDGSP